MPTSQNHNASISKHKFHARPELSALSVAISLTVVALIFLFQLWDFNPRVPVSYSGDGLLTLNGLRNMRFGGWYWSTQKLGAPFGQDFHDFPAVADNFNLVLLWFGIKIFRNEVLTFNLFFFGTYFLSTASGFIGARMLRLNRSAAVLVGVVYSFLPFHFQHGPAHLYLSAYWAIPLWAAFLLRELMGESISPFTQSSFRSWFCSRSTLLVMLISLIAASTGLYYAFFFLLLATGVLFVRRITQSVSFEWVPVSLSIFLATSVMALQYFPIWLYQKHNGNNLSTFVRSIADVEYYSLKISNLLLPVYGHRISLLADFRDRANHVFLIGEGADALGLFGSIGFCTLLIVLIVKTAENQRVFFKSLAVFTLLAVLISTVGGFAQFVSAFGFTQLRVMARMSVVIAFPSIVCSVVLLDRVLRNRNRIIRLSFLLIVGTLALLDTNPGHQISSYKETAKSWEQDRSVVARVAESFGSDAMIFQLPIIPFPEYPSVVNMTDYEHLKGYLHSSTLRWSYGGVKGRDGDWQKSLSEDPKLLVAELQQLHFQAIWINRNGYEDRGALLIEQLSSLGLNLVIKNPNLLVFGLNKTAL
jgi:phosphoglycerol transferase